jgi:hypothetical protein
MPIEKRKIRLVRNKRSRNRKGSLSNRMKKMRKSISNIKSIVPNRKRINLKIKLKINLLARKNQRNDSILFTVFSNI